jgi:adenine-specific DNA-methyltransferase
MSNNKKTRLELTWPGKEIRPRLEPRILIEDTSLSYHASAVVTDHDIFDNILIQGDNLLGLKALEQKYAGRVKCIFIDPPYNTGSAFTHYDDGMEHSLWLSMMRDRIELLRKLLAEDGSLWITIDDNESHYLKVMCDEIFGRANFVATCVWEKDKGGRGDADISLSHDNILIYAKDHSAWSHVRNLLPRSETQLNRFKNPDNDPRGPWRQGDDGTAKSGTEKQRFSVLLPSGRSVTPPPGRYWAFAQSTLALAISEGRAYFGNDGDRLPIIKRYLSEVREGVAPRTWWSADEAGTNQQAKRDHLNKLLEKIQPFDTPKPEPLLHRIIHIATNPGDLVLDSFLGSGTTAAVAHKMGTFLRFGI